MAMAKAFERYFYDFSLHDQFFKQYVPSKGQYIALRHVTFCSIGLMGLIDVFFPFNPPFPTIGWKGTWVCEADKHKALEMYKAWKSGTKLEEAHH